MRTDAHQAADGHTAGCVWVHTEGGIHRHRNGLFSDESQAINRENTCLIRRKRVTLQPIIPNRVGRSVFQVIGGPPDGANLYIIYKMYAIVEIQGQQFKVEAGKKLFVHHMQDAEAGATVEFDRVLLVDKDGAITVGVPTVDGAKVVCEVVTNLVKGDKVLVFHKKRRKGYRKLNGHRQQFTELKIKEVVA